MRKKNTQLHLLKPTSRAYGGELLKTRKGRAQARPIATRNTMHLVLRSSKARAEWSFRRPKNRRALETIVAKFARRYNVKILAFANVGNHLHFQIHLGRREGYRPFIRAVTGAIAMAVTGVSRWRKGTGVRLRFWDYRPFTRLVIGYRALLTLRDYIRINECEGFGVSRVSAVWLMRTPRRSSA